MFVCACAFVCVFVLSGAAVAQAGTRLCFYVYRWNDRLTHVACESELFIVWKPVRPSALSVTNDCLSPCMQTQTSRFGIAAARVAHSCLFYVSTCVKTFQEPTNYELGNKVYCYCWWFNIPKQQPEGKIKDIYRWKIFWHHGDLNGFLWNLYACSNGGKTVHISIMMIMLTPLRLS